MITLGQQLIHRDATVAEQIGVERALRFPRHQLMGCGLPCGQPFQQRRHDLDFLARLALRRHEGPRQQHGRAGGHERDFFLLERRGFRQHDVGEFRSRRHLVRGDGDEIQRAHGVDRAPRIGIGDQDVDAAGDKGAHGPRLAGQHGLDNGRVVAGGLPSARAGPQRETVGADGALFGFEIEAKLRSVQHFDVARKALRLSRAQIASDAVDVAADGNERMERTERLHADARCIDAVARNKRRWPRGIDARGLDDVTSDNAGQPGGAFCWEIGGAVRKLVEAVAAIAYVGHVIKPLGDQHVDHGQRQRCIRADARGEPQIGDGCDRRSLGIDDDQLGAPLFRSLEGGPLDRIGDS